MWASLSSDQTIGVPSAVVGASLSMMVLDSVLSSSADMTAKREVAEDRDRTIHRYHVDARAVGAHGVGLKRSIACLNP